MRILSINILIFISDAILFEKKTSFKFWDQEKLLRLSLYNNNNTNNNNIVRITTSTMNHTYRGYMYDIQIVFMHDTSAMNSYTDMYEYHIHKRGNGIQSSQKRMKMK